MADEKKKPSREKVNVRVWVKRALTAAAAAVVVVTVRVVQSVLKRPPL